VGWQIVWIVGYVLNAAAFVAYLSRRGYRRMWLAAIAALIFGPAIWLWWALIRYGERRGRARAERT
jgi:hypothetical protein